MVKLTKAILEFLENFLFSCAQLSLNSSHYVKFATHVSRFVPPALSVHLDMSVTVLVGLGNSVGSVS